MDLQVHPVETEARGGSLFGLTIAARTRFLSRDELECVYRS